MGLKSIFSNSFETTEFGSNQSLMTHYYQANYEKVKNTIIDISKAMRFKVANINDDFHEMLIIMPRGELIVTLFNSSPNVTSVDFKITTMYIIPLNRGANVISKYYESLNSQLPLKKIGGGVSEY
ncbi:MAG: hypothetical protein IKT40_01485 [Bacilli bacterium]|nr:hypothetical protein [Bacilli bacterium]